MPEGVEFPFPSLLFHEGRTYGQPASIMFLLAWYSTSTTLFAAILSPAFLNDCITFLLASASDGSSNARIYIKVVESLVCPMALAMSEMSMPER